MHLVIPYGVGTINSPNGNPYIPRAITIYSDYVYVPCSLGPGANYLLNKFDINGNSIFTKTYNMGGAFNIPRSITHDSNGNVILAGVGGTGFGWQILKCNSNGDSLWSKTLFSFGREARSVITDNEDNIVVTGWVNAIYKYDPDGNLLYNQTLGGDDNWEGASLLKYDDENVFVIGGKRRASGSSFDILLGKYSIATGDSIWTYVFNYPEPEFGAYGWDGAILNDSSLVVITQTNTVIGSTFYSNIYLY